MDAPARHLLRYKFIIVGDYRKTYTALSLYLSRVKWRVLRELVLSNWVK